MMEKLYNMYFKVYPDHDAVDYHRLISSLGIGVVISKYHTILNEEGIKLGIEILREKIDLLRVGVILAYYLFFEKD